MSDALPRDATPADVLADPRVDHDQLRLFDAPDAHPLLVVGCVHDHPASVFRARALVAVLEPDAVAVELPGLAVPLFERVGVEAGPDSPAGGEMSAALAAGRAVGARRVGIDALDARFLRSLVSGLRRESASPSTVRRVLAAVATVGRHAVSCRLSAALGRHGSPTPVTKRAYEHEVDRTDPPAEQATDERRQLTRSLSVLRAFERPVADDVVDAARERRMAEALRSHCGTGSVVAVVGFDHLSRIATLLEEGPRSRVRPGPEALAQLWDDGS